MSIARTTEARGASTGTPFGGPDAFVGPESQRKLATVKLTSIEHVAESGQGVASTFDLLFRISDGGANPVGTLALDAESLPPHQTKTYSEGLFTGEYPASGSVVLKFLFTASFGADFGSFSDETDGSNALQSGTQHFNCLIPFAAGGSGLRVRGRIDLG